MNHKHETRNSTFISAIVLVLTMFTLLFSPITSSALEEYGLQVGEEPPNITATDIDGKKYSLEAALNNGPVVVVFIRGRWYPYCVDQLKDIQDRIVPLSKKYNSTVVAITIDQESEAKKMRDEGKLTFPIISDTEAKIITKYNLREELTDELIVRFRVVYEIDLTSYSGKDHHLVSKPAVYVINPDNNKIIFAYTNIDYKTRAAAKSIKRALTKASRMMTK